ncbi:MAG TPA: acyl-CoA thioesterase [Flavobacteriales bacterium]|nr:acyl-CoA thioesterase [Flavobacteriales bacterium]HIO71971.1 acyl-CoA thioesterase [Flavobacteriales bacterium]
MEKTGRHTLVVPIRFADIDGLNHVNNAVYLTYIESARIKYFNEVIGESIDWNKKGIILASASINFKVPVELIDEEVIVSTWCSNIGTKSFELSYSIVNSKTKAIAAEASTTMVCFNYSEKRTIEMPELWKEKIKSYEQS